MKIFGVKVSKGNSKTFGRKLGNTLNVIGRKTINTIDKVAPFAALAADLYAPGSGQAVMAAANSAHVIDGAIRAGVSAATAKKHNRDSRMVTFGNELDNAKANVEHTNALLRQ